MITRRRNPKTGSSLVAFAVLIFSLLLLAAFAHGKALECVPDLEKAMYLSLDGYPCVRLLNLSGEIGCSNPGREKVVAPIVSFESAGNLVRPSAILVPASQIDSFFQKVSADLSYAQNVAGVVVESPSDGFLPGFSPESKFPLAQFSPYSSPDYEWNPLGSSIMWNAYDFPVFLLSQNATTTVRDMAELNSGSTSRYNVVEFDSVMQTTEHKTPNSESCLKARTCLPLGGYSVWSSLPPINISAGPSSKPLVLAVVSMDSASFFRDQSLGADSPLSGLISLLAAVDALSRADGIHDLKKQLVFLVLTGEKWGFIGSRKFLEELEQGTAAVDGLDGRLIEQVLEIGSVGNGLQLQEGMMTFFAHFEQDDPAVKNIISALEHASDSLLSPKVTIQNASTLNPGIPPSSLMTFLRRNSSIAGVVLEEFDRSFTNKFYDSHLDDIRNINSSSIVAAASVVARTLYILAKGDSEPTPSILGAIEVNASLVEEMMGCLLSCEPGLSCSLVKRFVSTRTSCPNHYVGVFLDVPSDTQNPSYVDDTSHFVWNFLADRTSLPMANASTCTGTCSNAGEVCVGAMPDIKGKCLLSSTRYIPAYSTRLKYMNGLWSVLPANSSDPLGIVDPVWTESYWNVVGLRAYKVQSSAYDFSVLLGGVIITVTSYVAVLFSQNYFMKVVKHD